MYYSGCSHCNQAQFLQHHFTWNKSIIVGLLICKLWFKNGLPSALVGAPASLLTFSRSSHQEDIQKHHAVRSEILSTRPVCTTAKIVRRNFSSRMHGGKCRMRNHATFWNASTFQMPSLAERMCVQKCLKLGMNCLCLLCTNHPQIKGGRRTGSIQYSPGRST
jgi:hypothetical protein